MDFTREPIIETVITPREGYRLVVRSSKGAGYEEHFVDALEVVSFGSSVFFRCLERPKPFIVPVADYEVLEVREPRMVLKTPSESQSSRAGSHKARPEPRSESRAESRSESRSERSESRGEPRGEPQKVEVTSEQETPAGEQPQRAASGSAQEGRGDRPARGRRQRFRRRRGQNRDEAPREETSQEPASVVEELIEERTEIGAAIAEDDSKMLSTTPMLGSILPPPTRLIRDDLQRLREKDEYKGAFYARDEKDDDDDDLRDLGTNVEEEMSFPFEISEEDIRMNEGGDQEVPQEGSFRGEEYPEEAQSSSTQDVQQEKG